MQLTILGSGTCVPSLKRSAPANYLKISGKEVLVDIGPGTLQQMIRAGINYQDIDCVFLSHFHADHVGELRSFVQAMNWTPKFIRKKDLTIIGPVGLKEFYQRTIGSKPLPDTYEMELMEIEDSLTIGGFEVKALKTIHDTDGGTAYRFIEESKSIVITGDADFDEQLIEFSKDADLLLAECSFPNEEKVEGHMIPKECGEIAKRAEVGKLIINHLYPGSPEKIRLEQTKEIFENTILAEDLLVIEI